MKCEICGKGITFSYLKVYDHLEMTEKFYDKSCYDRQVLESNLSSPFTSDGNEPIQTEPTSSERDFYPENCKRLLDGIQESPTPELPKKLPPIEGVKYDPAYSQSGVEEQLAKAVNALIDIVAKILEDSHGK